MLKNIYRMGLLGLSVCALLMVAACSSAENKTSKSTEQLAQEFSKLWIERWNKLPEEEMRLPEVEFLVEEDLQEYVLSLLDQWERENRT